MHFLAIGWKVAFATVPPANMWGGKACFLVALAYIGVVTAVVGEFASLLGCVLGIDDSITAITLVALGTSLPDTFASMTAAKSSEYADAAIGNVTGSNSVNVFLGLGLPWVIARIYYDSNSLGVYKVPAGEVAYSVFVFLVTACVCFLILIARRNVSTFVCYNICLVHRRRARRPNVQQVPELHCAGVPVGNLYHHVYHQCFRRPARVVHRSLQNPFFALNKYNSS